MEQCHKWYNFNKCSDVDKNKPKAKWFFLPCASAGMCHRSMGLTRKME